MALSKSITMDDGVLCRYHRVLSVAVEVNGDRTVTVRSYPTKTARAAEKAALAARTWPGIYARDTPLTMDYEESVGVADAYEWLKALPMFEGASDVLEEDA